MNVWDSLMKQMVWSQIGAVDNKIILDFGSGMGETASYYARNNTVIAVEPSEESINNRIKDNDYTQLNGGIELLYKYPDEYFDFIICHNVLEYIDNKEEILKEFNRVIKSDGRISVVKHNRNGRIMQMVVLLNDFDHANDLFAGKNGITCKFGEIRYYEDNLLNKYFKEKEKYGMRTFWDLQQNQEIQANKEWQQKMLEVEAKASTKNDFYNIAFFHHLILTKQ